MSTELSTMEQDPDGTLRKLQQTYGGLVRTAVTKRVACHAMVEDVLQEVWLKVFRHWRDYNPAIGKLGTWLSCIASRTAIDHIRVSVRRQRLGEELELDQEPQAGFHTGADEDVEANELSGTLQHVLDRLPLSQREAVELCHCQGYSQREAAAKLGVPVGTLKTRLALALRALRRSLCRV